jgi:pimeloyl-ACP methyl ester carboxylesterase
MKKQVSFRGNKIVYHTEGKGQPVLLVHGFGEDGTVWNDLVAFLKASFLLIVPDLPGSGKSELTEDMSMEGMAAIVKMIADQESAEQTCCIIGHSMGGYITLAFAEKYPEAINGFALFHSTAFADSDEKKETRRKGIGFIKERGAFEFLKTATPNLFAEKTRKEQPGLINKQIASLRYFSSQALIAYYEAMIARPDRTAVLRQAKTPVLFIIGEEDAAIPMADVLRQTHLPEKSWIYILADCGHMGMLEKPVECNQIIRSFLEREK